MELRRKVKEIERWLQKSGTKESRLGLIAAGNQRAVERIRDGSARISTLMAVLKYIRKNPVKKQRMSTSREAPRAQ